VNSCWPLQLQPRDCQLAPCGMANVDIAPMAAPAGFSIHLRPQQVDLWVRARHVCVGTAACPGTADFNPCAPQAKIYRFVPFLKTKKKKKVFIG
jgi:hypothetical protein